MKANYICPYCRGTINAGNNIILSAKTKRGKGGLLLLHEKLGCYKSILSASLSIEKEEVVDLFCPICHECLNLLTKESSAKYIRVDEGAKEFNIIISRIYGEKITFKVDKNKQVISYGEKISRFMDPEWFMK